MSDNDDTERRSPDEIAQINAAIDRAIEQAEDLPEGESMLVDTSPPDELILLEWRKGILSMKVQAQPFQMLGAAAMLDYHARRAMDSQAQQPNEQPKILTARTIPGNPRPA